VRRSFEEQDDVHNLLDEVEQKIFSVGEDRFKSQDVPMKEQVMAAIESIEQLYERRGGITGISTGFAELDRMTNGLHEAEMIVIAARPSMGKTALAMNIAEHVAINEKLPVAVFSLEMSSQQLIQRLLCSRARVNLQKVRDGFLAERDFPSLTAAASIVLLGGAGQPVPQRLYQAYSDQQKADLDKISAYLNGFQSLKAGFVQIGPQGGMDQGEVSIQKPGQIRFEYRPPSPILIVATGGSVYVKNSRLNTRDQYDLSDTPLGLLLNSRVDLKTNKAVIGVSEQNGAIIVRARTSANRNDSNITLVFSTPGIELRQWTVRDDQGGDTTVALQNVQLNAKLDTALFAAPAKPIKQARK